jgi:hypothetical protein
MIGFLTMLPTTHLLIGLGEQSVADRLHSFLWVLRKFIKFELFFWLGTEVKFARRHYSNRPKLIFNRLLFAGLCSSRTVSWCGSKNRFHPLNMKLKFVRSIDPLSEDAPFSLEWLPVLVPKWLGRTDLHSATRRCHVAMNCIRSKQQQFRPDEICDYTLGK